MTTNDNKDVLVRYVEAVWGGHDADAALDHFGPGYRRHLSPATEPLDATAQITRLRGFMSAFPDVTMSVETMTGDGDLVAFAGIMRGTHRGEFKGMAPTGRTFQIYLYDMVRIADSRIVEHWGGPDLHDLEQQLHPAE